MLATDISEADFNNYITTANKAISPFDLEIRNTEHQITGKRTYSLINSTDNPITQLATSYTADEIGYLKRVLDFMFETNNTARKEIMAITSMDAVRLAKAPNNDSSRESQQTGSSSTAPAAAAAAAAVTQGSSAQSLTMVQAQKMLDNLVVEGWLEKSVKGFYSLSPRALMELRGWLVDTYNDVEEDEEGEAGVLKIKSCFSCKGIITIVSTFPPPLFFFFFWGHCIKNLPFPPPQPPFAHFFFFLFSYFKKGQRCPKRTCACRLHEICIERFFRFQKSTKCPLCKTTDWKDNKSFVGERVLTGTDESLQGRRRSGLNGTGSQARKTRPLAARGNVEAEGRADSGEDS